MQTIAWMTALLAAAPAPAPVSPPRAHVVLVGIDTYADRQILPRRHAEADARALHDLLVDRGRLGVEKDHVRLLLGRDANRRNVLQALEWLQRVAREEDLVVFAFLGRGATLGERGDRLCYLAADSSLKGRARDALSATEISERFDLLRSRRVCVLLDVSFIGFRTDEVIAQPILDARPFREFVGDDGTNEQRPFPGRVLLAVKGVTGPLDLARHGLLTQVVLEGLCGAADDEDGLVTSAGLGAYVGKRLPELARRHGETDAEKVQQPLILSSPEMPFRLAWVPETRRRHAEVVARLEELTRRRKLSGELAAEGRGLLLERVRFSTADRELRTLYLKLAAGELDVETFLNGRERTLRQRQLSREEAEKFARKVVDGCEFVVEEYFPEPASERLIDRAIRGLYERLEEPIPEDFLPRLHRLKQLNKGERTRLLADVRQRLGRREDLAAPADLDLVLEEMLGRLDPDTWFLSEEKRGPIICHFGERLGVGLTLRKNAATDLLEVVTPLVNGPAHKAGLLPGDVIVALKREMDSEGTPLDSPEVTETHGTHIQDCVKRMLGKSGTQITLIVRRPGQFKRREFVLARERVAPEAVLGRGRKLDGSWDHFLDAKKAIGYVRIPYFPRTTAADLLAVLTRLQSEGMKGLVLDLRFNPGGLLSSSTDVARLFLSEGRVVTIKARDNRGEEMRARSASPFGDLPLVLPLVVLINEESASASEILAACLQDHKRAAIVGARSHGKCAVQNVIPGPGEMILTSAAFYSPGGRCLHRYFGGPDDWGVRPDRGGEVLLSRAERDELHERLRNSEFVPHPGRTRPHPLADFKDVQLDRACEILRARMTPP